MPPNASPHATPQAKSLSASLIHRAHKAILPHITPTPLLTSPTRPGVFFKAEALQLTGSFKIRGALHALLNTRSPVIITHSSGNHALAVAYACRKTARTCYAVIPRSAPRVKVDRARAYGAAVIRCADSMADRERVCDTVRGEVGAAVVHPFLDVDVVAGHGTVGVEILQQLPEVDAVVVPVGGGGLIAGIAVAVKAANSAIRVIGVEPRRANAASRSLKAGERVVLDGAATVADGLRAGVGVLAWEVVRDFVECVIEVEEEDIVRAIQQTWDALAVVVEPSAAAAFAATGMEAFRKLKLGKCVVVLCGGNVDDHLRPSTGALE